jgi:hypothetical protein
MMATTLDTIPTAKDLLQEIALAEAKKASEAARHHAEAEAEKKALIDRLMKPTGLTDEEKIQRGSGIIRRAVEKGLTEVQVYRFPNVLCTDRGRAIIQAEPGWETTLTGAAKELYQLWYDHLRPRGYKIRYEIVDWPNGLPGDVGVTLSWAGAESHK